MGNGRYSFSQAQGYEEIPGPLKLEDLPKDALRHMLIGSARVSKVDVSKSLDLQRDALQAEGVDFLFQAQGRAETSTTRHR